MTLRQSLQGLRLCRRPGRRPPRAQPPRRRLELERLEDRALPAITFVAGLLTVTGTASPDHIVIDNPPVFPGGWDFSKVRVRIVNTAEAQQYPLASVNQIKVFGLGGVDTIDLG